MDLIIKYVLIIILEFILEITTQPVPELHFQNGVPEVVLIVF